MGTCNQMTTWRVTTATINGNTEFVSTMSKTMVDLRLTNPLEPRLLP